MIEEWFDDAVALIAQGPGVDPIRHLLDTAQSLTAAPISYVIAKRDGGRQLIASAGLPFETFGAMTRMEPGSELVFDGPIVIDDVSQHPEARNHSLVKGPPHFRWLAAVPILIPGLRYKLVLCCADPRRDVERPGDFMVQLGYVATGIADTLRMLGTICRLQKQAHAHPSVVRDHQAPAFRGESSSVVSRFLQSTLIAKRRSLRRDSVVYHATAGWRAAIKPWQLEALKAIKQDPPAALVCEVAAQLADVAHESWGTAFKAVVPVACGHSGPNCLAKRLAREVARISSVPMVDAFETLSVTGTSHPRKNGSRPRMQVKVPLTEPVLLIDDVATSGAHLVEASHLLRATAPAVFPLVWIAAG